MGTTKQAPQELSSKEIQASILSEINRAVRAITTECYRTPVETRGLAIEFLARGSKTPIVVHALSDALRRFSRLLTAKEKMKIAELLSHNEEMPPITREYVRCSLASAIQKEASLEVGEALQRLYHKVCD